MASLLQTSTAVLSIGLLLACAGCAEDVAITPGNLAGTSSGSGGGTTAAATSTSSASGGTGVGGSAACVPQPDMTGTFEQPTCADLAVLAVSNAVITDAGGDGNVSAGETAVIQVSLAEIAGLGIVYPGVVFASASAGVTVTSDNWRYSIGPCEIDQMSAELTVASDVPAGTVVMITARAAMLSSECLDAPAIVIPITVH